jgi:hypothetical protein
MSDDRKPPEDQCPPLRPLDADLQRAVLAKDASGDPMDAPQRIYLPNGLVEDIISNYDGTVHKVIRPETPIASLYARRAATFDDGMEQKLGGEVIGWRPPAAGPVETARSKSGAVVLYGKADPPLVDVNGVRHKISRGGARVLAKILAGKWLDKADQAVINRLKVQAPAVFAVIGRPGTGRRPLDQKARWEID